MNRNLILLFMPLVLLYTACTPKTASNTDNEEAMIEPAPLLDREIFFGDPEISGGQISPDGTMISFRKKNNDVMNIWVKKYDEPFENAKPLTADTLRPVSNYFWSRDSKYILYSQDKGGDENYRVYAVDPTAEPNQETGVPDAKNLTPYDNVRIFIYKLPKSTPETMLVGINDRDPRFHDVYKLNIETGERELIYQNDAGYADFIFDWDGNLRMAVMQTPDGGTELLKREENGDFTPVLKANYMESINTYSFTPDNSKIYIGTDIGEDKNLSELHLLDLETGETEFVEKDPEDMVDLGRPVFSSLNRELVGTVYTGDKTRYYWKDEQYKTDFDTINKQLPGYEIYFGSSTSDESKFIVAATSDKDPGSVYIYDRDTKEVTFLYNGRPDFPVEHMASVKAIRYKARDGMEIPAYLTLPKGVEAKNLPTVIMPHGGPWARDYWGYNPFAQFFANRGYAVIQPNFRGSTGYGKEFLNAGNKEWGTGAMQHDLTDAVNYLIEEGIADSTKVAIFGGSYGGYAALAGLAFTPDVYAAGISFVGPSNIITLLNSIPPYWAPMKKTFAIRVGDMEKPEELEMLKKQSPLFSADKITAPLMVIQGANDPRVKQAESDQIVATMVELGRPVEYILAEDEGHGFRREDNLNATVVAIEKFLSKHIGGKYQEEVRDEIATKLQGITIDVNIVEMPDEAQ